MEITSLLNMRIMLYPDVKTRDGKRVTLFEALNAIRKPTYAEVIEKMRRVRNQGNIQSYRYMKKKLPAYLFSGIACGGRYKFDIVGYTSLMVIDIDDLENVAEVRKQLQADKYIVGVWDSPSQKGLKALIYLNYEGDLQSRNIWIYHENCAFPQVRKYILDKYGVGIDGSGADITRLSFVSYDPQISLKKSFEPFPVTVDISNGKISKLRFRYYYGNKDRIKALAEMKRLSKLLNSDS